MLHERRATSLHYDAVTDVARVHVVNAPGTVRTRTLDGTLLLDAQGFLVGVDLPTGLAGDPMAPEGAGRVVVMLGPHEAVASQVDTKVSVSTDASATVYEIRIRGAKDAIRARDRNPYVAR